VIANLVFGGVKKLNLQFSEAPECIICICTTNNLQIHKASTYDHHGGRQRPQKIKGIINNAYELEV
jgi:hypothetical protein